MNEQSMNGDLRQEINLHMARMMADWRRVIIGNLESVESYSIPALTLADFGDLRAHLHNTTNPDYKRVIRSLAQARNSRSEMWEYLRDHMGLAEQEFWEDVFRVMSKARIRLYPSLVELMGAARAKHIAQKRSAQSARSLQKSHTRALRSSIASIMQVKAAFDAMHAKSQRESAWQQLQTNPHKQRGRAARKKRRR